MSKALWFAFLVSLVHKGYTEAECDASDGTTVKCKFSEDIRSTRTNFTLYFYYNNGKTEMLVDCSWADDKLQCIEQEGCKCKQPVSDVAEIIVPVAFASKPGAYGCMTDTSSHENIKLCRFFNTQNEVKQEGQSGLNDQNHPKKNDFNMVAVLIGPIASAVVLIPIVIIMGLKKSLT